MGSMGTASRKALACAHAQYIKLIRLMKLISLYSLYLIFEFFGGSDFGLFMRIFDVPWKNPKFNHTHQVKRKNVTIFKRCAPNETELHTK